MVAATPKKTEVAEVEQKNTAVAIPDDFMAQMLADAGAGVQMSMDDVAVPYLYVLQTNSPQVNEDHEQYVRGARAGMFYNNVSGEVFDGREVGLTVIPCAYERKYVEWVDRDAGGGYVAEHAVDSGILLETKPDTRGRPVLGSGNLIVETAYHYVYFKNPNTGGWEQIIIPMKSTFLKKSRRWNKSLVSTYIPGTDKQAPRWLYPYQIKTVKEQKDTNVWSVIDIARLDEMVTPDQYKQAKKFAELMAAGAVVRATESDVADVSASAGGSIDGTTNKGTGGLDDDLPF